jgi:predicted phosphodiesterase
VTGPLPAVDAGSFDAGSFEAGSFERVALFADVHGNAVALRAALSAAAEQGAQAHLYLGCLTWGPEPREVVALALGAGVPVRFLRGNGERAVLELAAGEREPLDERDPWMVAAHGDLVDTVATWPRALTVLVGERRLRLCHGSPRSDVELLTPQTPQARLDEACAGVEEAVVVHGHTHLQYTRKAAPRTVVGCGSVGIPYTTEPGAAYWCLADSDGVHPQRTPYDVEEASAAIRATGYPQAERYIDSLVSPPTPDEIIADAEGKQFSD